MVWDTWGRERLVIELWASVSFERLEGRQSTVLIDIAAFSVRIFLKNIFFEKFHEKFQKNLKNIEKY